MGMINNVIGMLFGGGPHLILPKTAQARKKPAQMFKITTRPEFTHTVHVNVPVDGGHKEQSFKAKFKTADDNEAEAVRYHEVEAVKIYLRSIVVSMDELADDQDKPITYNDEVRDQMLALPHVRIALLRTYNEAFAKARVGN